MPRVAVPELDKIKDRILELSDADQASVYAWLAVVFEVRTQDRRAAERRAMKLTKEQQS